MRWIKLVVPLFFISVLFAGCRYTNPSVMLRTPRKFQYDTFPSIPDSQYLIAVDDMIRFNLLANDGLRMIDVLNVSGESGAVQSVYGGGEGASQGGNMYMVEFDGTIKLPIIGRFKIAGLKIREAEDTLEKLFSPIYKDPFVQLRVTNKRVTIFPGGMGNARVLNLDNRNITLFEALAMSGGISENGKAYKIKLIRGNLKKPQVFLIDVSRLETVKSADLVLQADDIIYVEAVERPLTFFARDIVPWIGLVSSTFGTAVSIYAFIQFFK
jgi:polysaccharide export outer membrane protein